jgi:DNA-binding transcriptional ArsR family regulator
MKRAGQTGKDLDERVGYALAHRVRVEILTLLNEGVYTADDIAGIVGETRQNVHHHLRELLGARSIEIARVEKRRNADLHYYRAVETPIFDQEAVEAMTPEERQATAAWIVQSATAEALAALTASKLNNDPQVCLVWSWLNLDDEGREKLAEEQVKWWERTQEIEAEAANRRAESGEEPTSYIVGLWGFERARTAPTAPKANAD